MGLGRNRRAHLAYFSNSQLSDKFISVLCKLPSACSAKANETKLDERYKSEKIYDFLTGSKRTSSMY